MDTPTQTWNASHSKKRNIEELWLSAYEAIYDEPHDLNHKDKKERAAEMQCINVAYAIAKEKFQWKNRDDWDRYFEHLREVTKIIINKEINDDVSIFQVLVALLHDIIEDTDIDADALEKMLSVKIWWVRWDNFPKRVATAVQELSKSDWKSYILSPQDLNLVQTVEWIKERKILPLEWRRNTKIELSKKIHQRYSSIEENAKDLRNHDFFSNMVNLEDDVLNVKFADRIHNLRTQWDPSNKQKVIKKIKETKTYFLPIAKERNMKAYRILNIEIVKLEKQLWYSVEIEGCIDYTKKWAEIALRKGA